MGTGAEIAAPEVAGAAKAAGEVAAINTIPELGLIATEATAATAIAQGIPAGILGANAGLSAAGSVSSILNTAKTISTIASPLASMAQAASAARGPSGPAARSDTSNSITNQPAVTPPVTMPTFGTVDTLNALRANIQQQLVRRGRQATILTSPTGSGDKLGN